MKNKPTIHLFVIWSSALYKYDILFKQLDSRFTLLNVFDVNWDSDNFSRNLARFYGEKLPSLSRKEFECGVAPFKAIIVRDEYPEFGLRRTSRGEELVNTNVFDTKAECRRVTGGGHKIHATNNEVESSHDIYLLTHKPSNYWEKHHSSKVRSKSNLIGCVQWGSFSELFDVLNHTLDYVVLRNFDSIKDDFIDPNHGDIDLLVKDKNQAIFVLNAIKVHGWWFRTHYRVNVNNRSVRFDIRVVGDDYYDKKWQEEILANRVRFDGFYIPGDEDYKSSLLYHALIHKRELSEDYARKLKSFGASPTDLMVELDKFMMRKGYEIKEPKDLSVYCNPKYSKLRPSPIRLVYNFLRGLNIYSTHFLFKVIDLAKNKIR